MLNSGGLLQSDQPAGGQPQQPAADRLLPSLQTSPTPALGLDGLPQLDGGLLDLLPPLPLVPSTSSGAAASGAATTSTAELVDKRAVAREKNRIAQQRFRCGCKPATWLVEGPALPRRSATLPVPAPTPLCRPLMRPPSGAATLHRHCHICREKERAKLAEAEEEAEALGRQLSQLRLENERLQLEHTLLQKLLVVRNAIASVVVQLDSLPGLPQIAEQQQQVQQTQAVQQTQTQEQQQQTQTQTQQAQTQHQQTRQRRRRQQQAAPPVEQQAQQAAQQKRGGDGGGGGGGVPAAELSATALLQDPAALQAASQQLAAALGELPSLDQVEELVGLAGAGSGPGSGPAEAGGRSRGTSSPGSSSGSGPPVLRPAASMAAEGGSASAAALPPISATAEAAASSGLEIERSRLREVAPPPCPVAQQAVEVCCILCWYFWKIYMFYLFWYWYSLCLTALCVAFVV